MAGTYGGKKEREHMAGKTRRGQMVRKNGKKSARENLYQL
jgi:hypothetical protein